MHEKLIVLSADALTYEDVEYLKTLPNYRKYLEGGCRVKRVRSIYPTITYPCHTTMCTGVWPEKHGVLGNYELVPGEAHLPWNWFYKARSWHEDIFYAAKRAGLSTAAIYWPVTGCHPAIDYLIDEYWSLSRNENAHTLYERAGSSPAVLSIVDEMLGDTDLHRHPDTDRFRMRCAREFILRYQPDVFLLHTANIDTYRHQSGLFNDKVTKGVEETDAFIGSLMGAVEDAGLLDRTNFALVSDHGMLDIKRVVHLNVLLAEAGLIDVGADGSVSGWKVFCQSGGTQALVYESDPSDKASREKAYALLCALRDEGVYGVRDVFTEAEARAQYHFGGNFCFCLETDGYTAFGNNVVRPLVTGSDNADYRYGKATHGHLPERGPQPVFSAKGPGFAENVTLESMRLVDEAPTFAKLLGLDLRDADGVPVDALLKRDGSVYR